MATQPKSWEVAARLEEAAKAVTAASRALDAVCSMILVYGRTDASPEWREWEAIEGTEHVHSDMAKALQALSDKYQAIADAEPDERLADELRTGFREEDFA